MLKLKDAVHHYVKKNYKSAKDHHSKTLVITIILDYYKFKKYVRKISGRRIGW